MPVFEMPLEELRHYKGCSPCPGDFKEYWREALGELEARGLLIPVRLLRLRRRA